MNQLKSNTAMADGKSEKLPDENFVFDSSEDEEISMIFGFKEDDAQQKLISFPKSIRIVISPDLQAEIGVEIGPTISAEHPWKQIKKDVLEDHISDKTKEQQLLKEMLKDLESGKLILIGYSPELSNEEDIFTVFLDDREMKEASEIIKRLELLERHKARAVLKKCSNKWKDHGSHNKVQSFIPITRNNVVNLETQSIFPVKRCSYDFNNRFVNDARDGYIELVPGKADFVNVYRMQVDFAVQTNSPKIHRAQQTDPTFPTNAWSQYLYEITEEEKQAANKSSAVIDEKSQSPKANNYVQELLNTLEFNQVDMYKNDYPFISKKKVHKYHTPIVEECLSFADRAKCENRYVSALHWHPEVTGIFAAAYNFKTIRTTEKLYDRNASDPVNRIIFEKNPVLVWGFDDTLTPKLELRSSREVTTLSFCPYDANLLLGGLTNGQLIIWDLKGQLELIEKMDETSTKQMHNRIKIRKQMGWCAIEEDDRTVEPVAISALDKSPRQQILVIKWLPRNYYCATTGQIRAHAEKLHRFILTASIDGSICFWDLDFTVPSMKKATQTTKTVTGSDFSPYQCLDNVFYPIFRIKCDTPITSVSIDESVFKFVPVAFDRREKDYKQDDIAAKIQYHVEPVPIEYQMKVVIGTALGEIVSGDWEGHDFDQGATTNEENLKSKAKFASIHDGPVLEIERNPFCSEIFLSIGGHILALWSENCQDSAIFWRQRKILVIGARWSLDRPSVFFITDSNGDLEIWDVLVRIDAPCMITSLGGHILSYVLQHKLPTAKKYLAVADYNSNIRILTIPLAFCEQVSNEKVKFMKIIQHELSRKKSQDNWVQTYYDAHKETIESQLKAKREAKELAERMEIEQKEHAEFLKRQATEEAKKKAKQDAEKRVDLAKRLEAKWRQKSYKRLLHSMMARRNISPRHLAKQMQPEGERRKYNEEKRLAIAGDLARIDADYNDIKFQLLPIDKTTMARSEKLRKHVDKFKDEMIDYHRVEAEAKDVLNCFQLLPVANFTDVLVKGRQRRELINRESGSNLEHMENYERKKSQRELAADEAREEIDSITSNMSPDALQRARCVTFIDDVPDELRKQINDDHEIESPRKNTPVQEE
ncbi:dynein axonemal intermediate chain 3 [Sabethes cyaneus]|uniref:dynein axonemal intermediate chain 3 n=1 Tax=Sabethes cyaneus TaxID=53552 RepID=UPI00237EA135|nr:dynein axonemal intermediate chain 3 [Sabethes cyaneus]